MSKDGEQFEQWLEENGSPPRFREPHARAVLQAAFAFVQQTENDYASRRILAHFLLHCGLGLKLAQIARLVGVTRPTASRQNKLSSRQVVREIQHRLSGRPYGKLLPRYAGSIAHFLVTLPQASRDDLLDFIEATWNVRVSLSSLHNFLHKYGLDRQSFGQAVGGKASEPVESTEGELPLIEMVDRPSNCDLTVPRPAEDFFGHTQYAGAFLLMPQVLDWWRIAEQCFSDDYGSLRRGFLTSVWMSIVGIERVFHLDEIDDPCFAVLTGDPRGCPTRQMVGAWRKHLAWNEVDRFCHRTCPWDLLHEADALLSFDEHSIPRWTKKFSIPKGFVTTRNKYMRCEKLYFGYDVRQRRFVTVKARTWNELRLWKSWKTSVNANTTNRAIASKFTTASWTRPAVATTRTAQIESICVSAEVHCR